MVASHSAVGGELLDPVVAVVGHVDVAGLVDGDAPGGVELAVVGAAAAPGSDEPAIAGELADLVAAAVGNEYVIAGVDGDVGGAVFAAIVGFQGAPTGLEIAVLVIDVDLVQPLVGHVDPALAVHGNAGTPDEFPVAAAVLGELAKELFLAPLGADGNL